METKFLIYSQQPTDFGPKDVYIDIVGPVHCGKTNIGLAIAEMLKESGIAKEISLHTDDTVSSLLDRKERLAEIFKGIGDLGKIGAIRIGESISPRDGLNAPVRRRRMQDVPASRLPSEQPECVNHDQFTKDQMDYVHHAIEGKRLGTRLGLTFDGHNQELECLGISEEEMQIELKRGNWPTFYQSVRDSSEEVLQQRRDELEKRRIAERIEKLPYSVARELIESMAQQIAARKGGEVDVLWD